MKRFRRLPELSGCSCGRVVSPERLLLVARSSEGKYERFRAAATARLRDRAEKILRQTGERWDPPTLPLDPPIRAEQISSGLRDAMPFGGTISFSAGLTPHFTRLKVTPPMLGMGAAGPTLWRAVRPAVKRVLAAEETFLKRHDPELLRNPCRCAIRRRATGTAADAILFRIVDQRAPHHEPH